MGMDITRVYFYTFFLLLIGCWLLYNKFLVGVGFITLATFSSYFLEYVSLHNYFASIVIYIGLFLDILLKKKYAWLIPFIVLGVVQGIAFQYITYSNYVVGCMELLSLCAGTLFIAKNIE
jgi:fluoride ion exporter CrcB/FEX